MSIQPFTLHEKLAEAFEDAFKLRTVYHYTTPETAQVFLRPDTAMLYCTWAKALNDDQEYKIGIAYALSHIAEVMHLDAETESEVRDLLKEVERTGWRMPWVMSFSGVRDELSQWIAYTDRKRGGYAIGFSFKKLEEMVKKIVREKEGKREYGQYILNLLPCYYLDYESEETTKDVQKFFKFLFVDYLQNFVNKEYVLEDVHKNALRIVSFICLFAAVIKHGSFKGEREYRLVVQFCGKEVEYGKGVEIVGGKPRVKIFNALKSEDVSHLITEIWVSPHGDKEVLLSMAQFLNIKYDLNLDVYTSNVPYNGR